jgi:hypothetical protein
VVNYDIENLKLDLNSDFNFIDILEKQLSLSSTSALDLSAFTDFGARLIPQAAAFIESQASQKEIQLLDTLIQRLYQALQLKHSALLRFEPLQRSAACD